LVRSSTPARLAMSEKSFTPVRMDHNNRLVCLEFRC
jgi:hypothetical protein